MNNPDKNKNGERQGLFTIKNSLFGIVAVLVLIVVALRVGSAMDASNDKAELEQAVVINDFSMI